MVHAQNLHDSDLLEHPDDTSLGFMIGMLITFLISCILLAIPIIAITVIQRLKGKRKSVAAE
jgi:hypothetical protein